MFEPDNGKPTPEKINSLLRCRDNKVIYVKAMYMTNPDKIR
jgi:hypothetical protein